MLKKTGVSGHKLILFGLFFTTIVGELLLLDITASADHEFVHETLQMASQFFLWCIAGLTVLAYLAHRRANQRLLALIEERDKSRQLSATLKSHKAAIDAHAIVSITDPDSKITYVNENFCNIAQYCGDEMIGKKHTILNSGYHPDSFFEDMYKTVMGGDAWFGDICNRAKDGSHYWVTTTVMPIHDAEGNLTEIVSIRTNITELKKKEEELNKSNQILYSTFDNFPGAISAYDKDLVLQLANPAFYDLLDLPAKDFPVGCNFADIYRHNASSGVYGDGDVEQMVSEAVALAKQFLPHSFERTTPNGQVLEVNGWPLEDGGFVSSHIDVTERHTMIENLRDKNELAEKATLDLQTAQQALSKTHENLLNSVNSMQNGFALWDRQGILQMANLAYRNIYPKLSHVIRPGLRLDNMMRLGCEAGCWSLDGLDVDSWVENYLKDHFEKQEFEYDLILDDGTQLVVSKKHLANGESISTVIDMTVQREREAELRRTRDALEHIAYFDALTTLPNRAHCQQDLEELTKKDGPIERFAVIQIDLDKFKRVNDTMGHAVGDHLLKEMGTRLAFFSSKVANFKPYRWGGDEFIAIVKGDSTLELEGLCQELTDLIAIPVRHGSATLWPTVSLGVAVCPDDGIELEALMIYADLALYKTKEAGRDGYRFFSAEMKEKVDSDIKIETDIRSALSHDQFELYFQPQISSVDESITGIEALVRWNHPTQGLLPPGLFMDIVESNGLAGTLGRVIINKAMEAAKIWSDEGLEFGRLSINISPDHLSKTTFADDFCESMTKYGVDPSLLAVELLESIFVSCKDANLKTLFTTLAKKGVHVELDDFGTGYASLSHLSCLPVDGIKIDRSFVTDITTSEKKKAIMEVVMSMSRLMQLRVVCEGIETHQELTTVAEISNCSVQGYLVSRPLNMKNITRWIREKRNIGALSTQSSRHRQSLLAKDFKSKKQSV
ncbi:sensor domain-containing protein [Cohaesibacter celericrescens]|uniref:sensor domain-containing protein n=1 Tax=Cohaesibacter celericrescens TaxID=2067669 RepID=UPI00356921B7